MGAHKKGHPAKGQYLVDGLDVHAELDGLPRWKLGCGAVGDFPNHEGDVQQVKDQRHEIQPVVQNGPVDGWRF